MPWEKGKSGNPEGRKGYLLEEKQKEKMLKAIDRDLALVERVQNGMASEYDHKIFPTVQARVLKYLDKMHAETKKIEGGDHPIKIASDVEDIKDYLAWKKQKRLRGKSTP